MKEVSELLLLLGNFSIRVGQLQKAELYLRVGCHLFQGDTRHMELYAYALFLGQKYAEALNILENIQLETKNVAFLRARIALVQPDQEGQAQKHLRRYLAA